VKLLVSGLMLAGSVTVAAQWGKVPEGNVPRDEKGAVRYDAPTPRTVDGRLRPDFSGMWMRADSGPPRGQGAGGRQGQGGRQGRPDASGDTAAHGGAAGRAPRAQDAAD
jgi:hypothetical protein